MEVLYIGNNSIDKVDELNSISHLPLRDVVFRGNPFTLENPKLFDSKPQDKKKEEVIPEIKKRLPNVLMIDGDPC